MQTSTLNDFLTSGKLPPSYRDRAALLDQARHQILSLTSPKNNMIEFVKNPATGVREAVEVDYTKRHFLASTVSEFEQEAAKISVVAAKARAMSFESGPLAGVAALKRAIKRSDEALETAANKLSKLTGESVAQVKARLVQRTPARAAAALPVVLRPQLPIVAAAAAANPAGILTAAEFSAQRPTMQYSEFSKLTAADKSRFVVKSRGKVVD